MVVVRDAEMGDLAAIVRLLADDDLGAARERPGEPLARNYLDAFRAIRAQSGNRLLVAEEEGRIVGCLQLMVFPTFSVMGATRAQIEGVRVASDLRGRGIGAELLGAAMKMARAAGASVMQLTSNRARTDAQRFYARHGFSASHVGMKLDLD